jgi:putative two-component system response regulator
MEHIVDNISKGKILIVDDEKTIRYALKFRLKSLGYSISEAASAAETYAHLDKDIPDLVLLDINLPDANGHDILNNIRQNPATKFLPVVMITGVSDRKHKIRAIEKGVNDFLLKPFDWKELTVRVNSLMKYKFLIDELEEAERVMVTLAKTIDARDSYTAGHSERVAFYAYRLGKHLNLPETELSVIRKGSLLHDIGKIAIRDRVLLKKEVLNPEEYEEIKRHTIIGFQLIQDMKTLTGALPIVYCHHERLDGSGYPEGLLGEDIPLNAQIVSIADVYDALITPRPYRIAYSHDDAMKIIYKEASIGRFDKELIDEFTSTHTIVEELNDNKV